MPDNNKATTAVIRALLDQMAEALTKSKPQLPADGDEFIPPPPRRRTRVNVREFNKAKGEAEGWWDSSGDGDPFIALRPRPKPRGPGRRR